MYTNLYTIFCRFCGIIWYCRISRKGQNADKSLVFRLIGIVWNRTISKALVPFSPLLMLNISKLANKRP